MEICSIDISAAADYLDLRYWAAGPEIWTDMRRGLATMLRRSNEMSQYVLPKSKGRYK